MSKLNDLTSRPKNHYLDAAELAEFKSRTLKLGESLEHAKVKELAIEEEREDRANRMRGMALGFRLSSEMIAAIFVGTLMGYSLDYFFNSKPWFFITFMLLGFIAGIFNVVRGFQDIQFQINVHKNLDKNNVQIKKHD